MSGDICFEDEKILLEFQYILFLFYYDISSHYCLIVVELCNKVVCFYDSYFIKIHNESYFQKAMHYICKQINVAQRRNSLEVTVFKDVLFNSSFPCSNLDDCGLYVCIAAFLFLSAEDCNCISGVMKRLLPPDESDKYLNYFRLKMLFTFIKDLDINITGSELVEGYNNNNENNNNMIYDTDLYESVKTFISGCSTVEKLREINGFDFQNNAMTYINKNFDFALCSELGFFHYFKILHKKTTDEIEKILKIKELWNDVMNVDDNLPSYNNDCNLHHIITNDWLNSTDESNKKYLSVSKQDIDNNVVEKRKKIKIMQRLYSRKGNVRKQINKILDILLEDLFYIGLELEAVQNESEHEDEDTTATAIIDKQLQLDYLRLKDKPAVTESLKTFFINTRSYIQKFTTNDYKVIYWILNNNSHGKKKFTTSIETMTKELEGISIEDMKVKLRSRLKTNNISYKNMQVSTVSKRKISDCNNIQNKSKKVSKKKKLPIQLKLWKKLIMIVLLIIKKLKLILKPKKN
jgi:hypothetical protein